MEWPIGHGAASIGRCMLRASRGYPHGLEVLDVLHHLFGGGDLNTFARVWISDSNSSLIDMFTILAQIRTSVLSCSPQLMGQDVDGMKGRVCGCHLQALSPCPPA
eukprot:scaffold65491_cov18-Prasinocladus_malaysianus.AAC.1